MGDAKYGIHVHGDVYPMSLYDWDKYTINEVVELLRDKHNLEPEEYELLVQEED